MTAAGWGQHTLCVLTDLSRPCKKDTCMCKESLCESSFIVPSLFLVHGAFLQWAVNLTAHVLSTPLESKPDRRALCAGEKCQCHLSVGRM